MFLKGLADVKMCIRDSNTTAATGKGFAIGSAALTGLALLASYVEEIRIGLTRLYKRK